MKKLMMVVVTVLLVVVGVVGCRGNSSGVSPVVEYNAAIQALEQDLRVKAETESALRTAKDEIVRKQLTENLENLSRNIDRLKIRIKDLGESL